MVIVMLGAEAKAGVMDRVCVAEMSLFPRMHPLTYRDRPGASGKTEPSPGKRLASIY